MPPHLFICDINPRQAIPEAIEQAAYLLAAGDYVVITDITPRNIDNLIAKVRKSHKVPYLLYHATDNFDIDFALHKSLKTYQGIITYPEMLMAQTQAEFANLALDGQSVLLDDYLKHLSTTDTFHSLHDLVKEGELKIATTGWLPLKPLAKNNNHEHPPLPPEFKIIEHWAKARNLEIGFVFNQFLGVLAGVVCTHLNATFAFNADSASPINLFVLASLEAGRGKSQLVKTLLKPLDTYHAKQIENWERQGDYEDADSKEAWEKENPRPPAPCMRVSGMTMPGLFGGAVARGTPYFIVNDEARTIFKGKTTGVGQDPEGFIGGITGLYDGVLQANYTRNTPFHGKQSLQPFSLLLSVQPDVMKHVLGNKELYWESGFNSRFLFFHSTPQNVSQLPYSQELGIEDDNFVHDNYHSIIQNILDNPNIFPKEIIFGQKAKASLYDLKIEHLKKEALHKDYRSAVERVDALAARLFSLIYIWNIACHTTIWDNDTPSRVIIDDLHAINEGSIWYFVQSYISWYLSNLKNNLDEANENEQFIKILNGIHTYKDDSGLVRTSLLNQQKVLRKENGDSVGAKHIQEICNELERLGYIKQLKIGNSTVAELHPDYKPT